MRIYELARKHGAQIIVDTSFWYLGKEGAPADPDTLPRGHREVAKRVRDLQDYLKHLRVAIESFPTVNFSLAHAGALNFTPENMQVIGRFIREHPNVYADLGADPTDSAALDVLVKTAGDDRVMFGTDWPHFAQGEAMQQLVDSIRRPGRFTERQVEGILGRNALAFVRNRPPGLKSQIYGRRKSTFDAVALHRSSVVIIGHDHLMDADHLLSMPEAGLTAKVLHVSVDGNVWHGPEKLQESLHTYTGWTAPALVAIEQVRQVIEAHPDKLSLALSAADIRRAHRAGRSAIVLGFEGGKPIEQSLEPLHTFYRLGLRVMQLTWAGGNDICDRRDGPACEGLTPFGRNVVTEMNRLGILIDPGHCSRKTFDDVVELSEKPIAVLHTTARGAKGTGDVDDEQIQAIARNGGVIGIHFFSHYLNPKTKATVEDIVDQVDYISRLVGIEYVALGGDFLELTDDFVKGHGIPPGGFLGIPEEFDSYDELVNITRALRARGYSARDIRKVLGENLLRVFDAVL